MTESNDALRSLPLLSSIRGLQHPRTDLRCVLEQLAEILDKDRSWSRAEIFRAGEMLLRWRESASRRGLWDAPPVMMTTTLDDAIGQGLQIIHLFGNLAGLDVRPLGLMQSPEAIIAACRQARPEMLGLTVLQFHSEEILCEIADQLRPATRVIAGGPIFKSMAPQALEGKGYLVLNHIRHFIDFLLRFPHADYPGRQDQTLL
ncbi:MAG: cobalamin B12-binding domain-containing protein [Deltaproteobacteria bacterium]|nr:cobalamin B12-binding domain-containing protein [Deltaproteobacteria bacterium]